MLGEKLAGLQNEHIDKHANYSFLFAVPAIAVVVFAYNYPGFKWSLGMGLVTSASVAQFVRKK